MMNDERLKERARRGLSRYFEQKRSPRSMLSLIILATALAGLGVSFALLKAGVTSMGLRYPLSVLAAYAVFLGLIRIWVEVEKRHIDPEDAELKAAISGAKEPSRVSLDTSPGWTRFLDGIDIPSGIDGEGCLVLLVLGLVVCLVVALFSLIGEAPVLLAEVFIDVALAGLLYKRMRAAANEHWLGTAIRKTWGYIIATAVLLSIAGIYLDMMAPRSDSMGKALKEIAHPVSKPKF